jgi:hypothetical protein
MPKPSANAPTVIQGNLLREIYRLCLAHGMGAIPQRQLVEEAAGFPRRGVVRGRGSLRSAIEALRKKGYLTAEGTPELSAKGLEWVKRDAQ